MSSSSCQIVEIVGVAGAGKSTLAQAICQHGRACHLGPFLDVGRLAHTPYVLHSLLGLIPLLMAGLRRRPRMSWREIKLTIYVSEWPRYLSRHCRPGQRMFVLDQGPVYALGRLEALGKPFLRSDVYVRWKSRMTAAWAKKLDRIIVLDAADPILVERIGGRTQAHETKGKSPEVGFEFLARHRLAFDQVIAAVEKAGGPEAHRIDTGSLPPGQIAAAVAAELGLVDRKPSA